MTRNPIATRLERVSQGLALLVASTALACEVESDSSNDHSSFRFSGPGVTQMTFSQAAELGVLRLQSGLRAQGCLAYSLSNEWAMTVFHCIRSGLDDDGEIALVGGPAVFDRENRAHLADLEYHVVGPDLALLHLATPVDFGEGIEGHQSPIFGSEASLDGAVVTCFGRRNVPEVSRLDFQAELDEFGHIDLVVPSGVDFGKGDSGGPCLVSIAGHDALATVTTRDAGGSIGIVLSGPNLLAEFARSVDEPDVVVRAPGLRRRSVVFTNTGPQELCDPTNLPDSAVIELDSSSSLGPAFVNAGMVDTDALGALDVGLLETATLCDLEVGAAHFENGGVTRVVNGGVLAVLI